LRPAAERGDEPVEALELKVLYDVLGFINVRFAGYRNCWANLKRNARLR
jgi:hypothetical protein